MYVCDACELYIRTFKLQDYLGQVSYGLPVASPGNGTMVLSASNIYTFLLAAGLHCLENPRVPTLRRKRCVFYMQYSYCRDAFTKLKIGFLCIGPMDNETGGSSSQMQTRRQTPCTQTCIYDFLKVDIMANRNI